MANKRITYEVGFIGDTSQLQAALKKAVASLQEVGTKPENLQKGLDGAAHSALELYNHLRNAYNTDTGKLDLNAFQRQLDRSGQSLRDYANKLNSLGPEGQQAFMHVAQAIGAAELPLKRSNALMDRLWTTMKNTARWRLTTGVLNTFIGGLQSAFGYSKDLNESLTNIRIVTSKSADEMARFAKEANAAAKELSTTTTTYTDASLIYYQQGLSDQEVKGRTDTTVKMANVTGQSAEAVSSQMTAIWNNFKEGSKSLESYADSMVALGATTASSSKEIAEGLEKFAPIARTVGLSFDYASAALATIVAATRESASVAGNALKTLFSRLEGLKLGETLDDGTDLNKYSQALNAVGISIKNTNGELKDMDVILDELGARWQSLARDEQMALAQTVGGVRQYANLIALMDNWSTFQQNVTTSRGSEGALQKQADIYAESWEAARARVRAAAEDVYDSLINPEVFVNLNKVAEPILKTFATILDAVGGLTGLLPIVSFFMTKVYSEQIAGVARDLAFNIGLQTGYEQERARALSNIAAELVKELELENEENEVASTEIKLLQGRIQYQNEINSKADHLTQYQKEQIENDRVILGLQEKRLLGRAQEIEKLKEQNNILSQEIDNSNLKSNKAFIGVRSELNKIPLGFDIDQNDLTKATNKIKQEFSKVLDDGFRVINKQQYQSLKLDQKRSIATDLGLKWNKNFWSEGQLDQKVFDALQQKINSTTESIGNLKEALITLGADRTQLEAYIDMEKKLAEQSEFTVDQVNLIKKQLKSSLSQAELEEVTKKLGKDFKSLSDNELKAVQNALNGIRSTLLNIKIPEDIQGKLKSILSQNNTLIKFKIDESSIQNTFKSIKANLDELLAGYRTYKEIMEKPLDTTANNLRKPYEEAIDVLKAAGQEIQKVNKISNQEMQKIIDQAKKIKEEASLAEGAIKGVAKAAVIVGADSKEIDKLIERMKAADGESAKLAEDLEKFLKKEREMGENPPQFNKQDWADVFVGVANGASRAAMAIQSVTNIIQVFQDKSLSATEKITRSMTSLTMVIPVVTSLMKGLAKGAEAAQAASAWAMIAVVGINIIVTAIDWLTTTQKEATEAIQQAKDSYNVAEQELERLNNELKTTQDRIKELQDLADSGDITIVEQEELENLKQTNTELERQLDLQERLADIELGKTIKEIRENGLKAAEFSKEFEQENQSILDKIIAFAWRFSGYSNVYDQYAQTTTPKVEQDIQLNKNIRKELSVIDQAYAESVPSLINTFRIRQEEILQGQLTREKALENYNGYGQDGVNFINAYYDKIDQIRKEHTNAWLAENINNYKNLEDYFNSWIKAIDRGLATTDEDFKDLAEQLKDARKLMFPDTYEETFLDPIIAQLNSEEIQRLKDPTLITDAMQDLFWRNAVDSEDLKKRADEVTTASKDILEKLGLNNLDLGLGYTEYALIAKFQVDDEDDEISKLEKFLNFLHANSGIIPVSIQVQTVEDARSEALAVLATGEMLSDEMIAKLQEAYQGFRDIANFSNLSIKEQIRFLSEEGKIAKEQIESLQNRRDDLKSQEDSLNDLLKELLDSRKKVIKTQGEILGKEEKEIEEAITKLENSFIEKPIEIAIEFNKDAISTVETELEKLKDQFERDPWKIQIETANSVAAEVNNVKKALSLINDDLSVSAENLVELGKRYPEALVNATYDANQNILYLDAEKYAALQANLENNVEGNLDFLRDASATELTNSATTAIGILDIITALEEGKQKQNDITLENAIGNNEEQKKSAKALALQTLLSMAKSEKEKRQQQLDTMVQGKAGSAATADTMSKNAEITAENYGNAADSILYNFNQTFRNIVRGSKEAASMRWVDIYTGWDRKQGNFKLGETLDENYKRTVDELKKSPQYVQLQTEIDLIDGFINALNSYLYDGGKWEDVQSAINVSNTVPDVVAETLKNLRLNDYDEIGAKSVFGSIFGSGFINAINADLDTDEGVEQALEAILTDPRSREAAEEVATNIVDALTTALANLLDTPTDKTDKGGGETEKTKKPEYTKLDKADLDAELKTLDDIRDRYHEITREIERQNRVLGVLDNQIERTYGLDRLELYEKKTEELNKLLEDQRTKSARASRYLYETDTPRLQAAFQAAGYDSKLGEALKRYGINFAGGKSYDITNAIDPISHELRDYEQIEQFIHDDAESFMVVYREFMQYYDKFFQEYEEFMANEGEDLTEEELAALEAEKLVMSEKAAQLKEDKELVETQFETAKTMQEERIAATDQYEDTLDVINTTAHEIEDSLRAIEDNKLTEITHRMTVILDVKEARKMIRDFTKSIEESLGDALTHGAKVAKLSWAQARDELAMYKEYQREYNELVDFLDNATEFSDTEQAVADLKELEGNIISSGEALLAWIEEVENMFTEALSAAADRFSYFTSQLEHNDVILESIKELYALQGQSYKTEQGFNRLQRVSQERLETQVAQAKLQRQWFENIDAMLQEAEAALVGVAETDVTYDALKKNRDALLAEQQEAQKQMLDYAQAAMETAQQMYLDQIERATYEFGKSLSGGIGLDLLQEKYDHYIEEEERYFDKVNEAYQVSAWYNKLQTDIDKTSNKLIRDRLKELQEEIDLRRESNTLSQYDLDILEAKYKVLQAQLALEDAENNKNQLRLVRDSQGNWNYQFTANEDDIRQKQDDLLKAENEWYNIAKNQTKEVTGEIISTWTEMQEKLNELYSDTSNFVMNEETGRLEFTEEAKAKEIEIREFYANKVKFLEQEKEIAISDMTEAGNQSMIHMAIAAGEAVEDITGITGREVEELVATTGLSSRELLASDLSEIQSLLREALGNTTVELTDHGEIIRGIVSDNATLMDYFDNVYARDLNDMTKATGIFEVEVERYINNMQGYFGQYGDTVSNVADNCGVSLDKLDYWIGKVSDSTDEMSAAGEGAVSALSNQLWETLELQQSYLDLAQAVWEYIDALRELAQTTANTIEERSGVDTFNILDYDPNTDWSLEMAKAAEKGDWAAVDTYAVYRDQKQQERGFWDPVSTEEIKDALVEAYDEGNEELATEIGKVIAGELYFKNIDLDQYATGGYTGSFSGGKLAVLHEKELVLNEQDTENILGAVSAVRNMSNDIFSRIAEQLDSDGLAAMALLGARMGGFGVVEPTSADFNQTVTIENVSFPGVTSSREIEEAFESLVNDAAQWARRRKS